MKNAVMGFFKTFTILSFVIAVITVFVHRPIPDGICKPKLQVQISDAVLEASVSFGAMAWRMDLTNHPFLVTRKIFDGFGWMAEAMSSARGVVLAEGKYEGVRVRSYIPTQSTKDDESAAGLKPFIVYLHGGWWVFGNVQLWNGYLAKLARDTGAVVVAVDYRLAPEHPFPAALDDVLAVTRYLLGNGAALDLDVRRAAVMGDSAGGNLAAAVATQLGGSASAGLKAQVLIYPMLGGPHSFQFKSFHIQSTPAVDKLLVARSYFSYAGGGSLYENADQLAAGNFSWDPLPPKVEKYLAKYRHNMYAGLEPGIRTELEEAGLFDTRVAPLLADDLSGVPQAFVATCEYDVLTDEGLAYVDRLNDAGVFVDHYHSPDGFHSMQINIEDAFWPVFESAEKMYNATVDFIKFRL